MDKQVYIVACLCYFLSLFLILNATRDGISAGIIVKTSFIAGVFGRWETVAECINSIRHYCSRNNTSILVLFVKLI